MNAEESKVRERFDVYFSEWKETIRAPEVRLSSRPRDYVENEPYRNMVKLGEDALPLVIEKLEEGEFLLNQAVLDITGKGEEEIFGRERRFLSEQEKSSSLVEWWTSRLRKS